MKSGGKSSHSGVLGKEGGLSARRATKREPLDWLFRGTDHQSLKTVFAVDVEAVKKLRLFVGVETDGAGQLVFQLF